MILFFTEAMPQCPTVALSGLISSAPPAASGSFHLGAQFPSSQGSQSGIRQLTQTKQESKYMSSCAESRRSANFITSRIFWKSPSQKANFISRGTLPMQFGQSPLLGAIRNSGGRPPMLASHMADELRRGTQNTNISKSHHFANGMIRELILSSRNPPRNFLV